MKIKIKRVQAIAILTCFSLNNLTAGEPEEFFDAYETQEELQKQIEKELIDQEPAAQRAAQLADQEGQQQSPTTDPMLPLEPTDPSTRTDTPPPTYTKPPETIIANNPQPIIPLNPGQLSASATLMAKESSLFVVKIENASKTGSAQELQNAKQNYKISYDQNVAFLSTAEQLFFNPTTVLSQGIEQYQLSDKSTQDFTTALTNATADHSWWDKITASTSTLEKKARARVQAGMAEITQIMQTANTLYMLLDLQQKLLNARATTTAESVIDANTYKQYAEQWQERYTQFQDFFAASSSANARLFISLAQTLQSPEYIDMQGDIGAQITQCYEFKKAYDVYTKYYQTFGVKDGERIGDNPNDPVVGLFDFAETMYNQIQARINNEFNRRQAQSFWNKFLTGLQEFIGLKQSISKQLTSLSADYLKQLQAKINSLSLLGGVFNQEHITQLATAKSDIDAVRALADLEIKTLSITDFRRYLDYQETVDAKTDKTVATIDTRLSDMFCPSVDTPQDVREQYTFTRPNSQNSLLKAEYVKRFIQYRLLSLGENPTALNTQAGTIKLFNINNPLWKTEYTYGTQESIQVFLDSIAGWDAKTKKLTLNFDPEKLGAAGTLTDADIKNLDNWHDLTQAIQLWARQDIARLETILQTPKEQNVDDADLALVRSYLQLRAGIVQAEAATKEITTMYRLADMCSSLLTKGIITQGLTGTQAVTIKPFKDNAIGMVPFFFGNPNNQQNTGGIAGIYAAIEAQYAATLLGQEQQADTPTQKPGYTIVPYVAPLQPIPALPTQPTNTDGGGHGHHGGEEPEEEKCYDKNKKEIKCPKKDPKGQPSITR